MVCIRGLMYLYNTPKKNGTNSTLLWLALNYMSQI